MKAPERQQFGQYEFTTAQIIWCWSLLAIFLLGYGAAFCYLVMHHEWGIK